MSNVNQIRMIARQHLLTRMTLQTGLCLSLFAQKRQSKCIGQGFAPHSRFSRKDIRMGNLVNCYGFLKMLLNGLMS